MDTHKKIREHISAFSDNELSLSNVDVAFAALHSADGEQAWNTYFRIGELMRAQASPALSEGFAAKLAARLAAEPPPGKRGARAVETAALARRALAEQGDGAASPAADTDAAAPADVQAAPQPKPFIASAS